ncbi:hypothetical protein CDD83_3259 [Cordyceps sp. RAO-2017]|nr:hypothetical protein CDD83_3259 [Cordyceps sp. RAO-2017]
MFQYPEQTPAQQYALAVFLPLLATVFVVLRFYARRLQRSELLWDDWLVVFSLFFTYLTSLFMILGTALGNQGQHMDFGPDGRFLINDRYVWFLKMLYAGQLSQALAIGPTKIAVLLLYRRIFRGRAFSIITWLLIAVAAGWTVAFFFANMLECVPVEEAFKNAPGLGGNPRCINAVPMYLSQVYSDVIIDALILAVPIPLVLKLRLPTRQKFAVCGIFLLGIITIASSCAKMIIFNFVGHELAEEPDVSCNA